MFINTFYWHFTAEKKKKCNKMNFPHPFSPHLEAKLTIDRRLFCLLRPSLAFQNWPLRCRLPISQRWLILWKLCPAGLKWRLMGEGELSVGPRGWHTWSVEQESSGPPVRGSVFSPALCSEKKRKRTQRGRPFYSSVWRGLDAINTDRVEWWSSGWGSEKT